MAEAIDEYFDMEGAKTVSGLALHLGFLQTENFLYYRDRDEFKSIVARARQRIRAHYEQIGQEGRASNFADRMLTRMGWPAVEKSQVDANVTSIADIAAAMGVGDAQDSQE